MDYSKLLVGLVSLLLLVNFVGFAIINSSASEKPIVDLSNVATKDDLKNLNLNVTVPLDPRVDKLCDLTDGCNYYTSTDPAVLSALTNKITTSNRDFVKQVSSLVGIDKDYLVLSSVSVLETKATTLTKSDKNKDNWDVQAFVKVKYYDSDRADNSIQTVYVLVNSVLDEGYYDSMTATEVTRTFEFS